MSADIVCPKCQSEHVIFSKKSRFISAKRMTVVMSSMWKKKFEHSGFSSVMGAMSMLILQSASRPT